MKPEYRPFVEELVELCIREDIGDGDHTSLCCIPADEHGRMRPLCKQEGTIAGIEIAELVLRRLDPGVKFEQLLRDGDRVKPGDVAFYVSGRLRSLLQAERILLNIMQRMSGVATQTAVYVARLEGLRTRVLDILAGNDGLLAEYRTLYEQLAAARNDYRRLSDEAESSRKDEEWLRYTVEELRAADLKEGEQARTEQQLATLESADAIMQALTGLRNALDTDETGALSTLTQSERELSHLADRYPAGGDMAARLRSVIEELKDIGSTAAHESERIDADPETLQRLGDRLNTIYSLEMKHKAADLDELLAKAAEYERRLAAIDNSDSALRKAAARVDKLQRQAEKAAAELHRSREAVRSSLCENIVATLARLGIADARFVVEIEQMPSLTPSGSDRIAFLFSANARIEPQSI